MINCNNIMMPDDETHLLRMVMDSEKVEGAGTYQYHKYKAALPWVRGRRCVLDVGAHVGLWSRVMSYDFMLVEAFEPVTSHLECLRVNVASRPNVRIHEMAIGNESGTVRMSSYRGNTGHSQVSIDGTGQGTRIARLDDVLIPEAPVDLMKIDVEGYELDVLKGAEATIHRWKPAVIVEQKGGNAERFGHYRWAAVALLESWGYARRDEISGDHILSWEG